MATPLGKIGRLPAAIREELNQRLLDNEPASKILPWLNALPETLRILDDHFGEEPVTPQNLSAWKKAGFADWLARRQRIDDLKHLSKFAADLGAAAGGTIAEGAAAIAGGRILELLEQGLIGHTIGQPDTDDGEGGEGGDLADVVLALARLRKLDLDKLKLAQRERENDARLSMSKEKIRIAEANVERLERQLAMAREKMELQTVEMFLKFYADKAAKEIVASDAEPAFKMSELRKRFFGTRDKAA